MAAESIVVQIPIGALVTASVTIFLAFIAGLIWLIRLEGRVNLRDALCNAQDLRTSSLENRILEELAGMRGEFRNDLNKIFDRLEAKQDKQK